MTKYPRIGNLQILQSAAGYYIGRLYYYTETESAPYSRESNYFKTEEAAQIALDNNTYIERLD